MQIRKFSLRFSLVFLTFIGLLLVFSVKLVLLQVFNSSHLARLAERQHNHSIELEPIRGTIYDRNLHPLALNVTVYSLYANPRAMTQEQKERALKHLPGLLEMDPAIIAERLARKKYFIWLKRKLPQETVAAIKNLSINGLDFINESKRYYPNGSLAAHVIGFAGIDNQGLEGIELSYNKQLHGKSGWKQVLRDARQRDLMIEKNYVAPHHGLNLVLTIDETIQYIAERALEKAYVEHKAKSATIIVMDIKTGEVLALANRPTYNLSNVAQSSLETRTNRAVSFVYEPGSVFKIITAAAALEEEKFTEEDKVFCENGKYRVSRHTLTDHRPHGTLTFREVFQVSSNIGVVKIAQKIGPDLIYKYGRRFNFGEPTQIDLQGEVSGWLKAPKIWSKTTIGAIPIGYEVTVTPLQLVSAMASIANDGVMMKPYVVKYIKDNQNQIIRFFGPSVVDRTVSVDTARRVNAILTGVVETGTGKRAAIKDVKVAGKTGTARKVENGTYVQGKYHASFMGFAPADKPRLAAIVVLEEPRPYYFGGTVAAPVFKEVVENSLKYLETSSDNETSRIAKRSL